MVADIAIIAYDATYGNSAAFAEGLRHYTDVAVWYRRNDLKGMYKQTKTVDRYPEANHYIIFAAHSLGCVKKLDNSTLILTDSTYLKNTEKYNRIIKEHNLNVWAMPDLAKLAGTQNIYYQPFIIPEVDKTKTELICHSPFHSSKLLQKGTSKIISVCRKSNLPLTLIMGKTWQETITEKAKHLICIDQLFQGIGKSGLEAMLLDCAVLSGIKPDCNNLPPIAWIDEITLSFMLLELIFDKARLHNQVRLQREWADKNLSPDVVARKVYESITTYHEAR